MSFSLSLHQREKVYSNNNLHKSFVTSLRSHHSKGMLSTIELALITLSAYPPSLILSLSVSHGLMRECTQNDELSFELRQSLPNWVAIESSVRTWFAFAYTSCQPLRWYGFVVVVFVATACCCFAIRLALDANQGPVSVILARTFSFSPFFFVTLFWSTHTFHSCFVFIIWHYSVCPAQRIPRSLLIWDNFFFLRFYWTAFSLFDFCQRFFISFLFFPPFFSSALPFVVLCLEPGASSYLLT